MKQVSRQNQISREGVAFLALRIAEMNHYWHETTGDNDHGVDGEIELVDPETSTTRNFRIGVQVKSTEGVWRAETDRHFFVKPRPRDLAFWLGSNQPILLVCVRKKTGEIYWRNVQQWAADPQRRASGLIEFDKARDRLDPPAATRFFTLEASDRVGVAPPGPLARPEKVKSNLMEIRFGTSVISSVASPSEDSRELFELGRTAGLAHGDVLLRERRLWTLGDFEEGYLTAIGATETPRHTPLADWTQSEERSRQAQLAELLRRTLLDRFHADLRWHHSGQRAYFKLWREGEVRRLHWSGRGKGRAVVLPRPSRNHDGLSGYRHDAAALRFRRLGDAWFMSIVPTYHFTSDGVKVSSFQAAALKKMKQQDRAAAVSQQLRMWEWLFTRPPTVDEAARRLASFHLSRLVELEIPVTAPEGAWRKPPRDAVVAPLDDEQLSFEFTDED